jgi:BirA family transcriptional regulator, biotin operon repressor / biotin---[acetyl-CoA-carboxylase] ligase
VFGQAVLGQAVLGQAVLGAPRVHLRLTDSTNRRARELAIAGAPHGTLVTAAEQTAGRGRQGRRWEAPPDSSLLMSLVLRWAAEGRAPALLPLIAAVAVCDVAGANARVKWPNDVVVGPALAKLAGILVEGRPQQSWAVLGIGLNVALRVADLPPELHDSAASLGAPPSAIEPTLERLLVALQARLDTPTDALLDAWRARDALRGRQISWSRGGGPAQGLQGSGLAQGIDSEGRLVVELADGRRTALDAGEVHLRPAGTARPGVPAG